MARNLKAFVAIFVSWFLLDGLGHGLLLASLYQKTQAVWRPQHEMKIGVIYTGVAITAATFVAIYSKLIAKKCRRTGVLFGLAFGVSTAHRKTVGGNW